MAEEMRQYESVWADALASVSLAAEYPVSEEVAARLLRFLGNTYRKYADEPYRRTRALRVYPAVHVLATTTAAAENYHDGGFWPYLADLLALRNSQTFHKDWGDAFLENLETLDLTTFANSSADAGTRYLGRILLHCGVPTWCLGDYYRIVTDQRVRYGLDASGVVARIASRAASGSPFQVDMPVNRFLRFGGEYAVDVTDRVFELLDTIRAGGDGTDVPLPDRFRTKALELQESGALQQGAAAGSGATAPLYPHLVLDPYGGGPLLYLPPVGDAPDGSASWIVTLDGDPQRIATEAVWPGASEPAPPTSVPIPRPIRLASAALEGREHLVAVVGIVDDDDPFLAFGEDGTRIPSGSSLPSRPVWLLLPGEFDKAVFDGTSRPDVIAEAALPPGWSQWSLTLVDLRDIRGVSFDDGQPHPVRHLDAARIDPGEPVEGVRTSSGSPVFSRLPDVSLPAAAASEASWDLTLTDGNGEMVGRCSASTSDAESTTRASLWGDVPRPVFGTFTLRARGPWGRGATRKLFIAEHLQVNTTPRWRRLTTQGLLPARVAVTTHSAMESDSTTLDLGPQQRDQYLRLSAHGRSVTMQVSPPHMSIAYQDTTTTTRPSVRPQQLYTEDVLEDPGTLILNVGADASPVLSVLNGPDTVQSLEPAGGSKGIYRFNLARIVETLRGHRHLTLSLGEHGALPVASIRPKELFTGVHVDNGVLRFRDCVDIPGLTALIYPTRAPWRSADIREITEGACEIPHDLVDAGPLLVSLRIEDPWAPEPVPGWPSRSTPCHVAWADGWVMSQNREESALSAFLGGMAGLPPYIEDFSRLWSTHARLKGLCLGPRLGEVRKAIEDAVFAQAQPALVAMPESGLPTEEIPALVIRSGLAWANLRDAHDETPPVWTTRSALPCTLLSAADSEWSAEEVEAAVTVCGDAVQRLLDGVDPHPHAGRFDDGADLFAAQPDVRDDIVSEMALVPKALLDADTRVLAAMDIIALRADERIEWLTHHAHKVFTLVERTLRMINDPQVLTEFRARLHPTADRGWRLLPSISLGLAFIARYAARGNKIALDQIDRQQRGWTSLAQIAPQQVTIDLIIAELLVAGAESRKGDQTS